MNLLSHLPDFSRSKILVVGDVMIDKYLYGEANRISPEAPVPVVKIFNEEKRLGGAANVALNFASIGCHVSLMGFIGNDDGKIFIENQLIRNKIDNQLLSFSEISTTTKLRIISRNFQLIRLDFENEKENYKNINYEEILKKFNLIVNEFDLIVFSDYDKGALKNVDELIKISNNLNIPSIVDPKQKNEFIYKYASVLKPNLNEFEMMVGICKSEDELDQKAFELIERLHLEALVLTKGSDGISLYRKDKKSFKQKSSSKEVYDVTGAGDTVLSIFGAFLSRGIDLNKAVHFANEAAGIVISKIGTSFITENDLIRINNKSDIFLNKLKSYKDLIEIIENHRLNNQKIVMTNGCFDILHAGHIDYLKEAKKLGDKLVVAVNSDNSIKRLKGEKRPINIFQDRIKVLSSLSFVDYLVGFEENTPEELIKKINPNVLVKGSDYKISEIAGADFVITNGGEVKLIHLTEGLSSSSILKSLEDI